MSNSGSTPRPKARTNRAWSIGAKLTIAFLLVALVPMIITTWLDLQGALASVRASRDRNMALTAVSLASRLDQLLLDTENMATVAATDHDVIDYLDAPPELRMTLLPAAQMTLKNVHSADPDLASVFVLSNTGIGLVSTNSENVGQDLSYREYYRESRTQPSFISEILTGSTSAKPGVYVARTVYSQSKSMSGVVVVKLMGEVLERHLELTAPGTRALLIDHYGVVTVETGGGGMRFHSLGTLGAETLALPMFDRRFSSVGVDKIESLHLDDLASTVLKATSPSATHFEWQHQRMVAGFAPLANKPWAVIVHEPVEIFEAPLWRLAWKSVFNCIIVGAIVVALAFLIARSIVRPVRQLTLIADRLQKGNYHVPELSSVPLMGDELTTLAHAFASMARGLELREKERDVFGRVVSPEVREKLLEGTLGLGGETLHVAVLFSDIRGFSTLTERTPAYDLVSLLNEYLTSMTEAVRPFGGYVNNFIGDAIVVVFGAPVASLDVEVRAARAALAMRASLAALNERRTNRGELPIANGIGLAAGPVVAGQIGSLERMLYTVIGDCVNVAARLESMTKEFPEHPILATRAIADAAQNRPDLKMISIGAHTVKGRVASVEVFGVHE